MVKKDVRDLVSLGLKNYLPIKKEVQGESKKSLTQREKLLFIKYNSKKKLTLCQIRKSVGVSEYPNNNNIKIRFGGGKYCRLFASEFFGLGVGVNSK